MNTTLRKTLLQNAVKFMTFLLTLNSIALFALFLATNKTITERNSYVQASLSLSAYHILKFGAVIKFIAMKQSWVTDRMVLI
jgi:hypothetical protein